MYFIVKVIDVVDPMFEIDEDFDRNITYEELKRLLREQDFKDRPLKDRDLW
jgi:hypothetical protein